MKKLTHIHTVMVSDWKLYEEFQDSNFSKWWKFVDIYNLKVQKNVVMVSD